MIVVRTKKLLQPTDWESQPEEAAKISRAKLINEESKAYCVAVYCRLHKEEI